MTAQEYIQSKLEELRTPIQAAAPPTDEAALVEAIYKLVTSKKFRKYSLSPELAEHIKGAIQLSVSKQEPINFTLVFGAYKLWRFEETPEADWAELFALMYYTKWLQLICALYAPGVWFDFFSEAVIVPRMNNIPAEDTAAYQASFERLLQFIKPYQPDNLRMTFNRVIDQYESQAAFDKELAQQLQALAASLEGGLPVLDDEKRARLDLNVHVTPEQAADPQWREKVMLLHDAYSQMSGRRPYFRRPDKIGVAVTRHPSMLALGTTKDSIVKFWVGVGALRPHEDSYRQVILSPHQLETTKATWQPVEIPGLTGKNFHRIRVT